MIDERVYIRQTSLVDPKNLSMPIVLIGAGTIGSFSALSLLKLGCQDITIYDDDVVSIHNSANQLYTSYDAERSKVEVLRDKLVTLVETPEVLKIVNRKATPEDIPDKAMVIMAVDSITTREQFFRYLRNSNRIFIDGRMGGNIVEVYTVRLDNEEDCNKYDLSIFPESEAASIPCSARSVVYNGFIMAGMITNIVGRISSGKTVPNELTVDLENFQLYI